MEIHTCEEFVLQSLEQTEDKLIIANKQIEDLKKEIENLKEENDKLKNNINLYPYNYSYCGPAIYTETQTDEDKIFDDLDKAFEEKLRCYAGK